MFTTNGEVSWEAHCKWYESSLKNRKRYLYVGHESNSADKVGVCRFDINEQKSTAEVSINLNPKKRGLKLSDKLLSAGIRAFNIEQQVDLVASIKKNNIASNKCFTKCGFILQSEDNVFQYFKLLINKPKP